MTDVGTGSCTLLAQAAAGMMGIGLDRVRVTLGDSRLPESPGSGGQWSATSATSGLYAAADPISLEFVDGHVSEVDGPWQTRRDKKKALER